MGSKRLGWFGPIRLIWLARAFEINGGYEIFLRDFRGSPSYSSGWMTMGIHTLEESEWFSPLVGWGKKPILLSFIAFRIEMIVRLMPQSNADDSDFTIVLLLRSGSRSWAPLKRSRIKEIQVGALAGFARRLDGSKADPPGQETA